MANSLMLAAAGVQRVAEVRVLGAIDVGRGPIGDIAVDADGATIVATNPADASVSILGPDLMSVDAVVPVGGEPFAVAAAGGRAFVGAGPLRRRTTCSRPLTPAPRASSPAFRWTWTRQGRGPLRRRPAVRRRDDRRRGPLARIDVESGRVDTVALTGAESTVDAVRVSPNGRLVYVATSDSSWRDSRRGRRRDGPHRGVGTHRLAHSGLVVRGDGRVAYVLGHDPQYGGFVEMIDMTAKRPFDIALIGGHPIQFALAADGTRMYVVYRDAVAVLCLITNEIVDTLAVGAQPSCVATSPDGARLYVSDYWAE